MVYYFIGKKWLDTESPLVDRRLIFLRGLANEQATWIFQRSTWSGCTPDADKRTWTLILLGRYTVGNGKNWLHTRNTKNMDQ